MSTLCGLCKVPRATGQCNHVIVVNGQVTMSEHAWDWLTQQLADARNRLGELEERSMPGDGLSPEQISLLADYYHERECSLNHIDQCGWYYENGTDYPESAPKWAHELWTKMVPGLVDRDRQRLAEMKLIIGDQP